MERIKPITHFRIPNTEKVIAKGSCGEARSQVHRARDFGYINDEEYKELIDGSVQLSKKISGFISYLKNSQLKGEKYSITQKH